MKFPKFSHVNFKKVLFNAVLENMLNCTVWKYQNIPNIDDIIKSLQGVEIIIIIKQTSWNAYMLTRYLEVYFNVYKFFLKFSASSMTFLVNY